METEEYVKVEVKYCELCAGLWLRYEGSKEVYCAYCAPAMREMARGKKKQVGKHPRFATILAGGAACA